MSAARSGMAPADSWAFDDEKALLFVHIPKTGGTSMEDLMNRSWSDAARMSSFRNFAQLVKCTPPNFPRMPTIVHMTEFYALAAIRSCLRYVLPVVSFSVLRQPLELRLSAWRHVRREGHTNQSFHEYVTTGASHRLPADFGPYKSTFGLPQTAFLGPCTVLFSRPQLAADWLKAHYYPSMPALAAVNRAPAAGADAAAEVTRWAREVVERTYADDFHLWAALSEAGGTIVPECARRRLAARGHAHPHAHAHARRPT